MKAGDIIGLSENKVIKLATLSQFSHVAIAINDKEVAEILLSGMKKGPYEDCIDKCKTAILFERPNDLEPLVEEILVAEYQKRKAANTKYSLTKMFYSGYLPILRNAFYAAALISIIYTVFSEKYVFIWLTLLFLCYSPLVYLIQKFCSKKDRLKRFHIPECLLKNVSGDFCSNLVVELDNKANGKIATKIPKSHEPRPNDVINACKALNYKAILLKGDDKSLARK